MSWLPGQRLIIKELSRPVKNISLKTFRRLSSTSSIYSTSKDEGTFRTTLQNIFTEQSKISVQKKLSSVKQARTVKQRKDAIPASVLMPFCTINGEPSLLFMVRPMTIPQHRGEVCFPGGKADSTDRDIIHTALRESHEEIGLQEDSVDIWGQMNPVPSRKDGSISVVPIIGFCGEVNLDHLVINKHEADCVFTRSIESLCTNVHSTQFRSDARVIGGYTLPVYTGGEHRIWGLTAIFIHQLLSLLIPELYKFKLIQR